MRRPTGGRPPGRASWPGTAGASARSGLRRARRAPGSRASWARTGRRRRGCRCRRALPSSAPAGALRRRLRRRGRAASVRGRLPVRRRRFGTAVARCRLRRGRRASRRSGTRGRPRTRSSGSPVRPCGGRRGRSRRGVPSCASRCAPSGFQVPLEEVASRPHRASQADDLGQLPGDLREGRRDEVGVAREAQQLPGDDPCGRGGWKALERETHQVVVRRRADVASGRPRR